MLITNHPSSFWLTSRISSDIFIEPLGLCLSIEYLFNFLWSLYILQMLGKIFKFKVFKLLENSFASQKIESRHFYSCSSGENLP